MTDAELWELLVALSDADLSRLLDLLQAWDAMSGTVVATINVRKPDGE